MSRAGDRILAGAREALAVARGEMAAAKITTVIGGPYYKDVKRSVIQHRFQDEWIVWNWDTAKWDRVKEPVQFIKPGG